MMIRLLDRTTFRQQITFAAGALCLLLVAVTATGSAILARNMGYLNAERSNLSVARSFADQLDQEMAERLREISNLAELRPMRRVWESEPDELRRVLDALQRTLPAYAWIGFVETGGQVRVATRRLIEGVNVSARQWFVNALGGPSVEDVHEAQLLANLLGPSPDGAPFRFVDVAVPVRGESGTIIGVLGAHLSWNWASALRDEVLARRDPSLQERIMILDRAGRVLLGAEIGSTPFARFDPNTTAIRQTPDGEVLAAFAQTRGRGDYRGLGWTVVVERPMHVAMASANRLTVLLFGLGLGAALVGVAISALFAAQVSRPMRQLTEALGRIGRDPGATNIERLHGSREVTALSAAIRSLLRRVGTAQSEARVAQEAKHAAESAARAADDRNMRLGADLHAMQVLADTDGLTGLLNRRAFLPFAEDAMNYLKRYGRSLCILMVDIDHFKRINDTFGHSLGDEAIRAVGAIITETIRTTDKVARFGGEEFVVLLREIDLAAAEALAERIREKVRLHVCSRDDVSFACTISIGIAAARTSDVDIEATIERADRALYAAKSGGRNRVCREDAPLEAETRQAA